MAHLSPFGEASKKPLRLALSGTTGPAETSVIFLTCRGFCGTFDNAKKLLDGILDLGDLKPWPIRKIIGYLLRAQEDFRDVFHLRKFAARHADWKPFLAHLLGFEAENIIKHYEKERNWPKKSRKKLS